MERDSEVTFSMQVPHTCDDASLRDREQRVSAYRRISVGSGNRYRHFPLLRTTDCRSFGDLVDAGQGRGLQAERLWARRHAVLRFQGQLRTWIRRCLAVLPPRALAFAMTLKLPLVTEPGNHISS
jgi:hypothetical protein